MPPTNADVEAFLRKTETHWFDVPGSGGTRRGVYGNLIQRDAEKGGWSWPEVEQQVEAVVRQHGGISRPQKYWTLLDALRDRFLRRASSHESRRTTYHELPAEYFRR
jgi:hypothetical protein